MVRSQGLFLFLLSFLLTNVGYSQDSLRTGQKLIPIPELSFNTDDGIKIAGEMQVYNYGFGSQKPFENFSRYRISYTTNGAFSVLASNDDVNAFDTGNRVSYYGFASRNLADYYFGDTDKVDYNEARFDTSDYYNFEMIRFDVGALVRTQIGTIDNGRRTELKKGISLIYEKPVGLQNTQFIEQANADGNDGAFLSLLELGLIIDSRDSEFRAGNGFVLDVGTRYSPPLISTHHGMLNYLNALGFLPITDQFIEVTLATRLSFQNSIGERPYWLTPTLGGNTTLRGFIFRRFSSDNALSYSAELRTWLISIPKFNVGLGGHIFVDGGRVFSNKNWNSMFSEHNFALGLGGVMSIFTPDFIMKAELAFSEDGTGVYLGTGYSF